jgi:hypothetical protein
MLRPEGIRDVTRYICYGPKDLATRQVTFFQVRRRVGRNQRWTSHSFRNAGTKVLEELVMVWK